MAIYVAGQGQQIDFEAGEDALRLGHKIGKHIKVRVADMQDAIAVERVGSPGTAISISTRRTSSALRRPLP